MKRFFFFFLPVILLSNFIIAQGGKKTSDGSANDPYLMPDKDQVRVSMLISNILEGYHYRKMPLNDSVSAAALDAYLQALDGNKLYFFEADIKGFEKYRYTLDDDLKKGNLVPAYHIYNVFKERFKERSEFVQKVLTKEFDFKTDEYYETDREKASYAKSREEQDEVWKKMLKHQALTSKLTGKKWDEVAKILKLRYENLDKAIGKYTSEDVFQLYMNAFAESYDPHTTYFSPAASANFEIEMSQSLEGIGAQLQTENDYTKVAEIIVGGPAFKSKKLQKNDKIIGVAQGEKGPVVDVVGWRIDEVVKLIRGKKGTVVRLLVLKADEGADAVPKEISLVREEIQLEEQVPSKEVINYNHEGKDYKVGLIKIPTFYVNFKDVQANKKDYRSTARDVRRILKELQDEKVDGVVVDLRFNGGGSLAEAIDLTGLFIPEGPVVQVKNSNGSIEVLKDPDPSLVYDGPLAVLVNRFSASASEIFAGAIQDYKRGIVIGEQTFGKGTVQNLLPLDRFITTDKEKLGQVKITLAKFYRVNGSSTQHKGVTPDIQLPSAFSAEEFGESSQKAALPWDKIVSTKYKTMDKVSDKQISKVESKYLYRLKNDQVLKDLVNDIEDSKKARKNTLVSLNEDKRKQEREAVEKRREKRELPEDASVENTDKMKYTMKEIKKKDPYLRESLLILSDLIVHK
jgi:carboxyl-terminal processing protease